MLFQFFKSLPKIPLDPVIVVIGAEAFLRQKIYQNFIDRGLGEALKEMNLSQFRVGDDELTRVIDACQDYPCLASRRVVLLLDVEKLKKKDSAQLINYLEDPQPTTLFILGASKLDGRLDWVKKLKKRARIVEIPEVSTADCLAWTRKCLEREGKRPAEGVPERLVDWIGNNLGALQQAVLQVCLYVGNRVEVEVQDVETLLVKVSEENVFEIVDALFAGQTVKLQRALSRALDSGEAPLKLLSLIHRHLSILLALRFGRPEGAWRLFRMPPFARRRYLDQASRFSGKLSYSLLQPVAEADIGLKGSPLPNPLILKNCVGRISELLAE